MNGIFMKNGVQLRWLNTAGFELVMSNGKHILIDPFLSGEIGGLACYPISLDEIHQCDYLLLSHIHVDHASDVSVIQKKFPKLNLFVGDLSADPLCTWQDIDCARMYRVRSGECYEFDDIRIEAFSGRHSESPRGYYRKNNYDENGKFMWDSWFGNLEFLNYLITCCDGTRILIWGGMTSQDQMHKFAGTNPDIAIMQVSPKQDFAEFARLSAVMNAKVIIPHHYDFTEKLFEAKPDMLNDTSQENREKFVVNGKFDFEHYMEALGDACRVQNPGATLLKPEHHTWYRFGFCWARVE
ncbi:MAG: MBL fold metallo-hydrolase [Clostridiales bacterium]|nr:MBL fold metallo-hydrolase [Clostridiales bacterium]